MRPTGPVLSESVDDTPEPWLSPTSATKLLRCGASFTGAAKREQLVPVGTGRVSAPNAGSLAHLAVRQWIEEGHWTSSGRGEELAGCYRQAARAASVDIGNLFDGRLTQSRLKVRADELGALLRSYG
jgi:hypothetical protein